MDIVRYDTSEQFVRAAAQWLGAAIVQCQRSQGGCTVGLCGGSTPGPVYALLSADLSIDWSSVTFFALDERYVPADHEDSNQRMMRETIIKRTNAVLLAPHTALPLPECIADYDKKVAQLSPDILVIGMGDDGHITSLFPPLDPAAFGPKNVIHTTTDRFAVRDRISTTLPVLLAAKRRLFLITGEKKAKVLADMQSKNEDVSLYPAQYLFDERTTWMIGK